MDSISSFGNLIRLEDVSAGYIREVLISPHVNQQGGWLKMMFTTKLTNCLDRFSKKDWGAASEKERKDNDIDGMAMKIGRYQIGDKNIVIYGNVGDKYFYGMAMVVLASEYDS